MEKFFDRKFEEVEGGYYDDDGFYFTPNGSIHHLNRFLGRRRILFH
jgi:hypothetical protein